METFHIHFFQFLFLSLFIFQWNLLPDTIGTSKEVLVWCAKALFNTKFQNNTKLKKIMLSLENNTKLKKNNTKLKKNNTKLRNNTKLKK